MSFLKAVYKKMSHGRSFQYFFKILFLLNWKLEGLHSSKKKLGNWCINKLVSPIWRGTPVFFLPWLNKFELSEVPLHKDVSQAQFSIFISKFFFAAIWKRTPVYFFAMVTSISYTVISLNCRIPLWQCFKTNWLGDSKHVFP